MRQETGRTVYRGKGGGAGSWQPHRKMLLYILTHKQEGLL